MMSVESLSDSFGRRSSVWRQLVMGRGATGAKGE